MTSYEKDVKYSILFEKFIEKFNLEDINLNISRKLQIQAERYKAIIIEMITKKEMNLMELWNF